MTPGNVYSIVTFATGFLLLLGWAYVTIDRPRSGPLFRKSMWLFALPILIAPWTSLGMWVLVACEEGLKAFGRKSEEDPVDRFWLISLFGLWELTLDKPFYGWQFASEFTSWTRMDIAGQLYVTALPVLMHIVTAAIYAFCFRGRLWLAFVICYAIHLLFNLAATRFYPSVTAASIETIVLLAILLLALPRSVRPSWLGSGRALPESQDQAV